MAHVGMAQTTHPHVVAALAAIQDDFRNPEKLTPQERARRGLGGGDTGVNYAYRGIDQIEREVQRLCGLHGVVISPVAVNDVEIREVTINNRPWTDSTIRVTWRVMGPGGIEDSFTGESIGWGRDNADKGYNKAFTSARKNFLLALFHIGDPADDSDGHTHERDDVRTAPTPPAPADPNATAAAAVFEAIKAADESTKQAIKELAADKHRKVTYAELYDPEWRQQVEAVLNAVNIPAPVEPAPAPSQEPQPTLLDETPADTTGPFPPNDHQRLIDWMKSDPANVNRFHTACSALGLSRSGQRRTVKGLSGDEVQLVLNHLMPNEGEPF